MSLRIPKEKPQSTLKTSSNLRNLQFPSDKASNIAAQAQFSKALPTGSGFGVTNLNSSSKAQISEKRKLGFESLSPTNTNKLSLAEQKQQVEGFTGPLKNFAEQIKHLQTGANNIVPFARKAGSTPTKGNSDVSQKVEVKKAFPSEQPSSPNRAAFQSSAPSKEEFQVIATA